MFFDVALQRLLLQPDPALVVRTSFIYFIFLFIGSVFLLVQWVFLFVGLAFQTQTRREREYSDVVDSKPNRAQDDICSSFIVKIIKYIKAGQWATNVYFQVIFFLPR